MRVTLMLVCLTTLLLAVTAAPAICRRGIPSGYNVAHGFGKRRSPPRLFTGHRPLAGGMPGFPGRLDTVYGYAVPISAAGSPADSF